MVKTRINKPKGLPKYVSQHDGYSCGPIAIINYWKYCGLDTSYKDLKVIRKILRTRSWGTTYSRMSRIFGVKWKKKRCIKTLTFPFIVRYKNHFWFCPSKIKGGFLAINFANNQVYHRLTISKMKDVIKWGKVLELSP